MMASVTQLLGSAKLEALASGAPGDGRILAAWGTRDLISERKFVAERSRAAFAGVWLSHFCRPDPAYPAGTVSSLYYDTPGFACYQAKLNGDFVKAKARLRWYDPAGRSGPQAFLEVKLRIGSGRRKFRVPVPVLPAWLAGVPLDDPGLRDLLERHGTGLRDLLPPDLQPLATVTYKRQRFVCPFSGARVALDRDIRLTRANARLLPHVSPVGLGTIVVELKGGAEAVPWLDGLQQAGFRQRSFSKYAACLSQLRQGAPP